MPGWSDSFSTLLLNTGVVFLILIGTLKLIHSNCYLIMTVLYFKAWIKHKIMFGNRDNRKK